ncbi:MAG: lycopene cyclase family protein [Spirochaetota bacterium]
MVPVSHNNENSSHRSYDFIMAGGGAAGLSLAYHLRHSSLSGTRILIVDRERKGNNDRTWCFWGTGSPPFSEIAAQSWDAFLFYGNEYSARIPLSPYRYYMVKGSDFYRHVMSDLEAASNVDFHFGTVTDIQDGPDFAAVTADDTVYRGRYVFDSRLIPAEFRVDTDRYHFVKQHFRGWVIRSPRPVFDPSAATFFDFRTPQEGVMRFVYVLPHSPTEALVEYTLFSVDLLSKEEYEAGIRSYIRDILLLDSYEVIEEEDGIIPMTDQPFPRAAGTRIMLTGTRGGRVKASTGFAFNRTQRDSLAIVRSLEESGHPFDVPSTPPRYETFDAMLIDILARKGHLGAPIFAQLFQNNPIHRILRFLDEEGGVTENLQLMATVPWIPFIGAWFAVRARRGLKR